MSGHNMYGINLSQIYGDAARIKGQRNMNQMNSMRIDEARRIEAERPMREQQETEQRQAMQNLRQQVVGGSKEARDRYIATDPEGAEQLIKIMDGEDDRAKQGIKENMDEMLKMSAYVMQASNDPQEMEQRYQQVKSSVPDDLQAKMPANVDPGFLADNMRRAMGASDYIKSLQPKEKGKITQFDHGGQSMMQQDGEIIGSAAIPENVAGSAAVNPLDDLKRQELEGKILERQQKIKAVADKQNASGAEMEGNISSLQEFQSDIISLMSNDRAISSLTGFAGHIPAVPGGEGADAAVLFDKITNTNTLENMGKMTGVLTDKDIEILRTAANGLERGMSVKAFKNRLATIKAKIDKGILTAAKKNNEYKDRMRQQGGAVERPAQPVAGTAKWGQR